MSYIKEGDEVKSRITGERGEVVKASSTHIVVTYQGKLEAGPIENFEKADDKMR